MHKSRLCLLLSVLYVAYASNVAVAAAVTAGDDLSVQRNIFASELYSAIGGEKLSENVVISPAAIQCSMALAYYGAKGKTATEMQTGLRLGASADAEQVAKKFGEYQQTFAKDNYIRLFNNIYINENLEFKAKFREIAQKNFDSNVEKADFHPPYNKRTADRINKAADTKTNGRITNVLPPEDLNDFTEGVIVNALSMNAAPWQKAFRADKTTKRTFKSGGRTSFEVDTMWTMNNFKYGELSSLDAKVIELPYQNTEYSMVLLLPNSKDGLGALIQRLAGKNLLGLIESGLSTQKVEVYLPKFSVAFGTNLVEPFKKLGVSTMFTRDGDFGNLYRMFVTHYINSARHKAYFEIAEAGAEQSMESSGLKSLFSRTKKFEADHPFIFVIKHQNSIILMGHLANYAYV